MKKHHVAYRAYLIRFWQETQFSVWRAALEDPHTGERKGFASLEALFEYLRAQTLIEGITSVDDGVADSASQSLQPNTNFISSGGEKIMQSTTTVQPSNPPKNPIIAALLSFGLLGGVGQMYLGQTKKGVILIVATLVLSCVGIGVFVPIIGAYDAYVLANKLKEGKAIGDMEFFWQANVG